MSEGGRHGLEAFLRDAPRDEDPGVTIRIVGDTGLVNLRGDVEDEAFAGAVRGILGNPLPVTPNTFSAEPYRTYWLGPDEWLVATPAGDGPAICSQLEEALAGAHAAINDVSAGNVPMRLGGPAAREVLAAGCPLDLHPKAFAPGQCAQTGLAKAGVLLALLDDTPEFELVVRRSFADYLARWLAHAARRSGRSFSTTKA